MVLKPSKRKQKLYEKYLKRRTIEIETASKSYKMFFESIKWRFEQNYYLKSYYQDLITKIRKMVSDQIIRCDSQIKFIKPSLKNYS